MKTRIVALVSLMVMLSVACGARLDSKQRAVALRAYTGTGGTAQQGTGGSGPTTVTTGGGGKGGGGSGGTNSGTGGNGGGGGGGNNGGGGGGSSTCAGGGAPTASDVGVTPTQLRVGTVSDVSGVQPGLFQSTFQAMQALAAYTNSQGGVCGRQLVTDLQDDQTNSSGNRNATLDACHKDFALVGSVSAFDDGGASVVNQLKCPDMTAVSTNPPRAAGNEYTYSIYPNRSDYFVIASANYVKREHPDVVKNAAIMYLNAGVTAVSAAARQKAYEGVGFTFIYKQSVQILESNYTPYVLAMKNHNPPVKYLTMVSDYQSIVRLLQAMKQQSWHPEVMQWDSVVYSQGFLDTAQGAADGSELWVNTALLEEVSKNPEMQLYEDWLHRVAGPSAQPDYFGLYAWSAGRLFVKLAQQIGPNLTRPKLIAALKGVHAWDGNGLHAPHDIGAKIPSRCLTFLKVRGGRFVRTYPSSGFDCEDGPVIHQ